MVVSCGFISCLSLKPDDHIEMNIASLNVVEKKSREVFFDVLIEVRNSLVILPVLVADGHLLKLFLAPTG